MDPTAHLDVVGYDVEGRDGRLGTIDAMSNTTAPRLLVLDTGVRRWGKKRLIPSAVVTRVDHIDRKVYVSLTKREVKHALDYDKPTTAHNDGHYEKYCLP